MPSLKSNEASAWKAVPNGWRQLYGNFQQKGLSVEDHSFKTFRDLDWGKSFHNDSLELCLNLAGSGDVRHGSQTAAYRNRTVGFYCLNGSDLSAVRAARQAHTFITLEWSRETLSGQVQGLEDSLHPLVREWLDRKGNKAKLGPVQPMSPADENSFANLRQPPVAPAAAPLWYQSKVTELLAQCFFERPDTGEMFCHRHQRLAHERVEHVISLLKADLADAPDLETLSKHVGCSPFYLSRTFSKEMGQSIPQYLRHLRMRRASELLRSGEFNVTEAALEVGYSSLGHFSKAFCEATGCCPSLYPRAEHLIKPGF